MSDEGPNSALREVSLRELGRNTSAVVKKVEDHGITLVLTRQGRPIARLEPVGALDRVALAIGHSPDFAARQARNDADIEAGRTLSVAEVDERLNVAAGDTREGREVLGARLAELNAGRDSLRKNLDGLFDDVSTRLVDADASAVGVGLMNGVQTLVGNAIDVARIAAQQLGDAPADDADARDRQAPKKAVRSLGAKRGFIVGGKKRRKRSKRVVV